MGDSPYWAIDFVNGVEMVREVLPKVILDVKITRDGAGRYAVIVPALKLEAILSEAPKGCCLVGTVN
jgi:hypothetical protein